MSIVSFSYADLNASFVQKTDLKRFIAEIFKKEGKSLNHLTYVFCSDAYLLDINKQFLQHDDYTDIITFDLSEDESTVGEVYISIERVRENAVIHKTSYQQEVKRVLFHGALHLCGFKDKKKSEIEMMRYKEDFYLRLFHEQQTQ